MFDNMRLPYLGSLGFLYHQRYNVYDVFFQRLSPARLSIFLDRWLEQRAHTGRKPNWLSRAAAVFLLGWKPSDRDISIRLAAQFRRPNKYVAYRLGDRLLRVRVYSEETQALLKHAAQGSHECNAIFRYIGYLTQRYGYSHRDLRWLSRRFADPRFWAACTRSQKLIAAVVLLRGGDVKSAQTILARLPKSVIASGALPLYIQRNIFKHRWTGWETTSRGSSQYIQIKQGRKAFEDLITRNAMSFCVVGNGPSEVGRGKGHEIDANAVVIRLNAYTLTNPQDYGSKQSVWVRVPNQEANGPHTFNNSMVVIASNQFEYKRKRSDKYLLQPYLLGKEFTTIPGNIFRELIAELQCLPSTGLAVLYWIYTLNGPIPASKIFGFSHLQEAVDFSTHYFDDLHPRQEHIHAWEKEIAIMSRIIRV